MIRMTATFDQSGYGNAARDTFMALIRAGYDVATNVVITPMSRQEMAACEEYSQVLKHLSSKAKPTVNIAQLIPPLWHYAFQKNTHNIGYFFWETDRLCADWVKIINTELCNEVWVPCESNKQACLNSGVTKPIYVVPQYTKTTVMPKAQAHEILPIPGDENTYHFYSIFQWSARKNPEGLIRGYLNEFEQPDNVMLVLKTYGPASFTDRRWIKETIQDIKAQYKNAPPIFLIDELLKPGQIGAIHAQCQCYVHAGRGEGHNIPLIDAMAYGRQTITTKLGGIADWIEDSSYVIPHALVDIDSSVQAWGGFYQSTPPQKWGYIETADIRKAMRQAYNEKDDFAWRSGKYADILEVCSERHVTAIIKERLAKVL